jgi:hypothetical protein
MNKLTKVGLSALCGSLASVAAAQAGSMNVSGSATATYTSNQGDTTGNPIGLNSAVTFTGSGELDNGTAFTVTLTGADQGGYTSGSIVMTTAGGHGFSISQATGGNGIGGYDDKMPTAWEETWGHGLGTGIDLAKGVGSSSNIQYTTPSIMGTKLKVAYSPRNTGGLINDKSSSGDKGSPKGKGIDIVLDSTVAGQNIFLGYSTSERDPDNKAGNTADPQSDHEEAVAGAIFSIGPVKAGIQATAEFLGDNQGGHTNAFGYRNVAWGVSFNVNDNLSLSYGEMESTKGFTSTMTQKRAMTIESFQIAYTMGGASIKVAQTEGDNLKYVSGASMDKDGRTIALSLAF